MTQPYVETAPSRAEVDQFPGATVVDFGTNWCGFCRAAEPLVDAAFGPYPAVRHIKVEDGSGRPLGRSFGIKLWPTLVFLKDGQEVARVTRPGRVEDVAEALAKIA